MKKNAITTTDIQSIIEKVKNDPKFEKRLEESLPTWAKKTLDTSNTVLETAQEMMLVVNFVLSKYHNFGEDELKEFAKELDFSLNKALIGEKIGISQLSHDTVNRVQNAQSMKDLATIAGIRLTRKRTNRAGIALPEPDLKLQ